MFGKFADSEDGLEDDVEYADVNVQFRLALPEETMPSFSLFDSDARFLLSSLKMPFRKMCVFSPSRTVSAD